MLTGLNNKRFVSHLESYAESTCISIKARNIKFAVQTKYERMRGPELAGLTLKMTQATMFRVTEDVSCCTDKCMQAPEALYFFRDVVQAFL